MIGIDFDKNIIYKSSSFREFEKGEYHVDRFCRDDVLLLVYDGVLRFTEDGIMQEVKKGEYYIQRANLYQSGDMPSDTPKYLYVHFNAEWTDKEIVLPVRGAFDHVEMMDIMKEMDEKAYGDYTYTERLSVFLRILLMLKKPKDEASLCVVIAKYIEENYLSIKTLDEICESFNYSKNHIINIFKSRYKQTPFEYVNLLKLKRAKYLMRVTSKTIEEISFESGFNNYSHFYRLFLRQNGASPYKWRKKIQLDPLSDQ